jgi:large subunit ribosomal protein L17
MRHNRQTWKLGRKGEHRLAMLRNLATSLFEHERIHTTAGRAKALRPFAERLITLSRREGLHARRLVARDIQNRDVVKKLFDTLAARYNGRSGGYTRLMRLGPRWGDGAEMAVVELVGSELKIEKKEDKKKRRRGGEEPKTGKATGARPEGREGGREGARSEHEHTRAVQPRPSGAGGRRDRGTGTTKKGQ